MVLKLYYDLLSQPSRAIYIFLKVNNIPFEPVLVNLRKGEHKEKKFADKLPFGSVPVIEETDNNFILTESVAILTYLAQKYAPSWYPSDPLEQARVNEFLNWQHMGLRFPEVKFFLNLTLIPMMTGKPIDWNEVKTYRPQVEKSVGVLNDYFLKRKGKDAGKGKPKFVCGEEITIADLLCVCELMQLEGIHEESIFESNPEVKGYIQRVKDKTKSVFDEAQKTIREFRSQYKKPSEQTDKPAAQKSPAAQKTTAQKTTAQKAPATKTTTQRK